MNIDETERGFSLGKFFDTYGHECSIQKSSLATDDAIWLGIDKPKLTVFESSQKGKYVETPMPENFSVFSRMHLNREQVSKLIPILQKFVDTGEID